jgi:hypothetical protein
MIQAAGDADPVGARDQRVRTRRAQCIKLRTVLPADLDDVFEACVGDERDARAFALEQCVGGHRGAMNEQRAAGDVVRGHDALQTFDGGACGIRGRGRQLQDICAPAHYQHDIREGAAGIDRNC